MGIKNTMIATIYTPHSLVTGLPGLNKFDKNDLPSQLYKIAHLTQYGLKE